MKKTIKIFGIGLAVLMILVMFSPVMSADPLDEPEDEGIYGCIFVFPEVIYQLYKNIQGWPYKLIGATPL
jgi:hypothetical protein